MADIIIVLAGESDWQPKLASQMQSTYQLKTYTDPTHYVTRLTDDHAALILVDGKLPDWRFWATTPKTSPATRRIPIVLVSEHAETRSAALLAGADVTLTPAELIAQFKQLFHDYARMLDPAVAGQLDCDCRAALPPLAVQGVEKFNAGEYYRQHDLFEEQWVHTESPVRDLYRAILQVGVAYYQIERGNHRGALKMLLRSVQWLSILPDVCQGVDIRQLREDSYRVRAELERMSPADISHFDRSLLKPVKRVP
ncbi:MAG: DUF309 domain-containing protein [Anaerolineae bacterium]